MIFRFVVTFFLFALIDYYAFQAIRQAFRDLSVARWVYWGITTATAFLIVFSIFYINPAKGASQKSINLIMGLIIATYVPKMFVILILMGEDIVRYLIGGIVFLAEYFGIRTGDLSEVDYIPGRRKFVSQLALGIALIPLAGIIHGIWKGRYNYKVIIQKLGFGNLPEKFDGFKIVHISDIHSGSFDSKEKVEYGISLINAQKPDLILFTGDMVNNVSEEMIPWIDTFAKLESKYGKFSVLGNHDYGDYVKWPDEESKAQNLKLLEDIHSKIGFRLLKNESEIIEIEGQKINIVGVENWGKPPFPQFGDLVKATENVKDNDFNILLSHDPSHFDLQIKDFEKNIALTLSGHTHGMQFGIEIPGWIKWSPVKFRYPKWAGLYEENNRKLYVNRGFGYLAFPGRVGIWPEITLIELQKI